MDRGWKPSGGAPIDKSKWMKWGDEIAADPENMQFISSGNTIVMNHPIRGQIMAIILFERDLDDE